MEGMMSHAGVAPHDISKWFTPQQLHKMAQLLREFSVGEDLPPNLTDDDWRNIITDTIDAKPTDTDESFFVVDLGAVIRQMARWKAKLPRVTPFYAVKCNGNPALVRMMDAMESGFDCASLTEFSAILSMGTDPNRIVFANPCKQTSHIKAARRSGLSLVTFDNLLELDKMAEHWPEAELLLRIRTDDSAAICQFSTKFGASMADVPALIDKCVRLNLNLVGVSFHVGSGCQDEFAFVNAAKDAKQVFDMAAELGLQLRVLDIGGGFPGDEIFTPSFDQICNVLQPALDEWFPP
eukprot:386760_1